MAISTIGTDALASAAVTSAKLASGAPSTSQLPAGTVLQMVSRSSVSGVTTTSTSWLDTGASVTITPSSASNKILLIGTFSSYISSGNTFPIVQMGFYRNSDQIQFCDVFYFDNRGGGTLFGQQLTQSADTCVDSPGTTSEITYKLRFRIQGTTISSNCGFEAPASLIAMEIAA